MGRQRASARGGGGGRRASAREELRLTKPAANLTERREERKYRLKTAERARGSHCGPHRHRKGAATDFTPTEFNGWRERDGVHQRHELPKPTRQRWGNLNGATCGTSR